jgi:hypothetical protein
VTTVRPGTMAACLAAALATTSAVDGLRVHGGGSEKINGYAEFKRGDTVMVDGHGSSPVRGPK